MHKLFLALVVALYAALPASSQNLYDTEHSRSFSEYLMQSGQYRLASVELERLCFMDPENDSIRIQLIQSYLLQNDYPKSIQRMQQMRNERPQALSWLDPTLSWALLRNANYTAYDQFQSQQSTLSTQARNYYQAWSLLLQHKTQESIMLTKNWTVQGREAELMALQQRALQIRRKSPFVAAGLSALLPGSGKWYAGEPKDAAIGFVTIGIMAFQAYRGFKKDGASSVYGWISASLGAGFYFGNIYGSARSARRYNQRQWKKLEPDLYRAFVVYR
jgi:hypothetical protein